MNNKSNFIKKLQESIPAIIQKKYNDQDLIALGTIVIAHAEIEQMVIKVLEFKSKNDQIKKYLTSHRSRIEFLCSYAGDIVYKDLKLLLINLLEVRNKFAHNLDASDALVKIDELMNLLKLSDEKSMKLSFYKKYLLLIKLTHLSLNSLLLADSELDFQNAKLINIYKEFFEYYGKTLDKK